MRHGGAGLQIAHSGTVAGLIFDAHQPGIDLDGCARRIKELGFTVTDVIEPAPAPPRRTAHLAVS